MAHRLKTARPQVTLKQIAQESQVSIGTVSRVLRGEAQVSAETELRVQEAAQRLRYRPNLLVRGIQTGKTQTIGVLLYMTEEFYLHILRGISDELSVFNHVSIVLAAGNMESGMGPSELEQIHHLIDRRVDGVILTPVVDAVSDRYLHEVWEQEIPLVTVTRELPHTHADFVGTDDEDGARRVAEHLLALGHRRLAHIGGPQNTTSALRRRAGFENAIAKVAGASAVFLADATYRDASQQARQILALQPRPTAIFCANDLQAESVYQAARESGVRIPDQLSVVGFSDSHTARWMTPALTSVNQNPYQIGREAARLILERSHNQISAAEPVKRALPAELVIRQSTAAPTD